MSIIYNELNNNFKFKGVWIPSEIYLRKDLSWSEKILLIEINYFFQNNQYCKSNKYLAEFLQCSAGSVANMLTKLRGLGLVKTKSFDGKKRMLIVDFTKL